MTIDLVFLCFVQLCIGFVLCRSDPVLSYLVMCDRKFCEFKTSNTSGHIFTSFNGELKFQVRASKEVHITLSNDIKATNALAEICIGCEDNQISTLSMMESSDIVANTSNVLSSARYSKFWVRVKNNIVSVGHGKDCAPFLAWQQSQQIDVKYVSFRTVNEEGSWVVENDDAGCWIPAADGNVPEGALVGGYDTDGYPLYIARVHFMGSFIPGKLSSQTHRAYVAYGTKQYEFGYYEVLVPKTHRWIAFNHRHNPREISKATHAGLVGNSTVLYVARKEINGVMTPGKMDFERKSCYFPFGDVEQEHGSCEILISDC